MTGAAFTRKLDGIAGEEAHRIVAADVCRGVGRVLAALGMASVTELTLPTWRRADVVGLSSSGDLWIVEVKSSVEDFRCDQKWPEYRDFCDRLFFAVAPGFPVEILPADAGLILADRYGGEIVRTSEESRLTAARRKALTLRFARVAAGRLMAQSDPGVAAGFE